MGSLAIIVALELGEFCLQIWYCPEQGAVEELAPKCTDQSFHERMRERDIRNRLDFGHSEHSEVGLPLMESIQRIMIRVKAFRRVVPGDRSSEHATQRDAIDDAGVNAETNDAPGKLVHHNQYPMSSQRSGLTSEQVATPQAVFGVAEKGEPGGPFQGTSLA